MRRKRTPATGARLYDLVRRVRPLYRALYRAVDEALVGTGLTIAERALLERLRDGGAQTVPELADALALERQPVQRVVDRLARATPSALVARGANPRHRRSPRIALTPAGEAAIDRVRAREAVELRRVARTVDAADLEASLRVADAILDGFGRA